MPGHAGDPSQFSKDQLKSVLISHNVLLPQGDHRKAVYLQLYLKHILPKDKEAADFSSDDEDMLSENDLLPVGSHRENGRDKMAVKNLSNTELKEQLLKHGVNPGPILPSTRSVYEKKLQQLLEEVQFQENGAGHEDQYSDSEDEGFQLKNQVEMRPEVNEDRSDGAVNGMNNYSQGEIPACLAAEFNQNLATLGDDFSVTKMLKQMERRHSVGQTACYRNGQDGKNMTSRNQDKVTADKNTMTYRSTANTPKACVFMKQNRLQPEDASLDDFSDLLSQSALGMSATRRKPIKGAAGRPIQFRYDDIVTRARMQEQTKDMVTETKAQRLIPVPVKIAIFIFVVFIALVILSMENSPENPFKPLTEGDAEFQQP
ncbi:LEM domain-containing protein 1 isoform X2 [Pseudophryne corroboree]|uniref:LEM domain-containing protein 1 isoform X2 n=1 Tax=Pseudophryne corroboree TaxID=495146 RepID=UPI003081B5DB